MLRWFVTALTLSLTLAVPASAQVMYRCASSNGYVGYGFQTRPSFDCTALTMADAYKDGVVLKELSLVCSGTEESQLGDSPGHLERRTETFHLVNGRWENSPCLWSAKHILCGKHDSTRFGIPSGPPQLSIDRFSGSVDYLQIHAGVTRIFKGACEIKTKPKF